MFKSDQSKAVDFLKKEGILYIDGSSEKFPQFEELASLSAYGASLMKEHDPDAKKLIKALEDYGYDNASGLKLVMARGGEHYIYDMDKFQSFSEVNQIVEDYCMKHLRK